MKIKTNLRAGKGGASGAGQNGSTSTDSTAQSSDKINNAVFSSFPVVSRCPGI